MFTRHVIQYLTEWLGPQSLNWNSGSGNFARFSTEAGGGPASAKDIKTRRWYCLEQVTHG
jgi:hypothetical protein